MISDSLDTPARVAGIVPAAKQPSLPSRLRLPVAIWLVLAACLGWALLHMRYSRPPAAIAAARTFRLSPDQLPSARSAAPPAHPAPRHLYIPSLRVSTSIVEQPSTSRTRLPLPPPTEVGIYSGGGRLERGPGTVLLAGHVVYDGVHGALWDLHRINPGADVWTTDERARLTHWRVYADPLVDKQSTAWPLDVYSATGARRLVIVTCGGTTTYAPGHGYHFAANQFAYATPIPGA